jgi:hypothetical protein
VEHTFFSAAHGTFTETDHILEQKASLYRLKMKFILFYQIAMK